MNVIEIKNGVQVNKEFDKVKVQGFFQTSEMLENVLGFRYLLKCQTKVRSFVVQEENTDLVLIHTRIKNGVCYLLGSLECFDYVDCIYGDISLQKLTEAFETFFDFLRKNSIHMFCVRFIDAKSQTYAAIKSIVEERELLSEDDVENVAVLLEEEAYDDYFSSLTKHAKQNIRTAYNRISTDQKSYECKLYVCGGGKTEKRQLHKECMRVYQERLQNRYGRGLVTRIGHYADYVSKGVVKEHGTVCALLIDGEVAAFLEGFIDKSSILVPRLAINEKYANERLEIYQGCAQFGITRKLAEYIVRFHDQNPKFNRFFQTMYAPDESYFHTIVYNSPFVKCTPDGKAITRPHLTNFENLTYFEYPTEVTLFKEKKDWPKLRDSGFLFFRKASSESKELLDYIDEQHLLKETKGNKIK